MNGFYRLVLLLKAGYRFEHAEGAECAFLKHPKGRSFPQWRLMVYDNGTIVGMEDMRIRSDDDDSFKRFLKSMRKP